MSFRFLRAGVAITLILALCQVANKHHFGDLSAIALAATCVPFETPDSNTTIELTVESVIPLINLPRSAVLVGDVLGAYNAVLVLTAQPERLIRIDTNGQQSVLSDFDAGAIRSSELSGPRLTVGGDIVLWHGPSRHVIVLAPDGSVDRTWSVPGTSRVPHGRFFVDQHDDLYIPIAVDGPDSNRTAVLLRFHGLDSGSVADTVRLPTTTSMPHFAVAKAQNGLLTVAQRIPFYPIALFDVAPSGAVVWTTGSKYVVFAHSRSGERPVVRRRTSTLPVPSSDRAEQRELIVYRNRVTDPSWRYTGDPVPDHLPAILGLQSDSDGRFWITVPLPPAPTPPQLQRPLADRPKGPSLTWSHKRALDLFDEGGRYLGRMAIPDGSDPNLMLSRGNHLWIPRRNPTTFGVELVEYRMSRRGADLN